MLQLRGLDTGAARDVSGVLRVSKGGGGAEVERLEGGGGGGGGGEEVCGVEEGEWLYQVKGDGSVRVWTRGE